MRSSSRPVAALAALLALAAVGAHAQPAAERGRVLIERNCASCHAVGAADIGPLPAAPPLRDLEQRYPVEMLEEALAEGILTGHPSMPEFRFSPAEIADVVLYLKSIQTRRSAALVTGG